MATIIAASIDLAKIDKSKIQTKNGAMYYNITININDEADKYGNICSIITNQTKEEREAKAKKQYIGNGKMVWSSDGSKPVAKASTSSTDNFGDMPF
jgi:hypothetical protein